MDITYYGHSAFKLKGKTGTVVTDPYHKDIGFSLPSLTADMVTISHDHSDHNAQELISGTARRDKPFIVTQPGEYEVGGISVFGTRTHHDDKAGEERGINTVFTIFIDEITVCHLGDLGHELTNEQISEIGAIDVLLCPVGGFFTIDAKTAVKNILMLEPSYVIPMHYRTPQHAELFKDVQTIEDFLKEYGMTPTPQSRLTVEKGKMPEETELVVLDPQMKE